LRKTARNGVFRGCLNTKRRADYLPEQSPPKAGNKQTTSKHTDDSLLEEKDNVVWLFLLLTNFKKSRQWWACNNRNWSGM